MYRLVEQNCYGDKNDIYRYGLSPIPDGNGPKWKNHEEKQQTFNNMTYRYANLPDINGKILRQKIVVLSGAGVSAESGIATFWDNDGSWIQHDYKKFAIVS